MYSIEDPEWTESGVEIDMSAILEEENVVYEKANRGNITISVIREPPQPERTPEEQADFEISTARIAFVLGYGTQQAWEDALKKWGREKHD